MSRGLAVLLAALAGGFVGLQPPINARLKLETGSLQAATVSFLVGTLALVLITGLSSGGLSGVAHAGKAPWWALLGGLVGGFYVVVALLTVHKLGASGLTAIVVSCQLAISVAIDRFGWLGVAKQQIGATRVVGLLLLIAGMVLVVRR